MALAIDSVLNLSYGARGPAVAALRDYLRELDYPLERGDVFDAVVERIVLDVQLAGGAATNGRVTLQTARLLVQTKRRSVVVPTPSQAGLSAVASLFGAHRVPEALRTGQKYAAVRRALAALYQLAPAYAPSWSFAQTRAWVAEWLWRMDVRESWGQNRGPWVDVLVELGGGTYDNASPWCARFVSAVTAIAAWLRREDGPPFYATGSASSLWTKSREERIERDELGENVAGGIYVRTRTSSSASDRDIVLAGNRAKGHTGIVIGRLPVPGGYGLLAVAGNSSGAGHSQASGSGRVAYEILDPAGDRHAQAAFERLVGITMPKEA